MPGGRGPGGYVGLPMPGDDALLELIRTKGYLHTDTPLQLASGEWSQDFVDGKKALAHGDDLRLACELVVARARAAGIDFDAVGGLTMGADHLSHGIAMVASVSWFTVRKEPKGRGTGKLIEGAELGPGMRALVVEDVVTTGSSALKAVDTVAATGATVVGAATLMDRGDAAAAAFAARGIPYVAMLTYADLGIPPVGGAHRNAG